MPKPLSSFHHTGRRLNWSNIDFRGFTMTKLRRTLWQLKLLKTGIYEEARLSFSQNGEDMIVRSALDQLGITKPTYIDIGANDPFYLSNTATSYLRGGNGILAEPIPKRAALLRNQRPRDNVV